MGQTSTTHRDPAVIQAEYDALASKKTKEAYALRQELKAATAADYAPPGIVPATTLPPSRTKVERDSGREILAPDLTAGGLLAEKTAVYWCGIRTYKDGDPDRPHPPMHADTLGGVTFASWYNPWEDERDEDEDGTRRGHYAGMMLELGETAILALKNALKRTLVRWRTREGAHAHGYKVTMVSEAEIVEAKKIWALDDRQVHAFRQKHARFQIMKGDEPFAAYIYCVKMPEGTEPMTSWRPSAKIPDSVLVTGIELP